jgi:biopolymer transport protein ExbD
VAKPPKAFDVWFVTANTVYRAVPYNVVADWAQQGRLAATDMVRPAGSSVAWAKVADHEFLSDYLPRRAAAKAVPVAAVVAAPGAFEVVGEAEGETVELPDPEPPPRRRATDDDDEVDMIPLIDISMVLLVFFIILRAAGALAPVDVPEMRYAGELSADPNAITITIDKKDETTILYSVRLGQKPPRAGHDGIPASREDERREAIKTTINALNELLLEGRPPPEVRIACRRELPNERVIELQAELDLLYKNGKINSYSATVVEAPQK